MTVSSYPANPAQRISLGQQIDEIEFQLRRARDDAQRTVRGGKISAADARMHVLRLEEAVKTLKLISHFERPVKDLLVTLLKQETIDKAQRAANAASVTVVQATVMPKACVPHVVQGTPAEQAALPERELVEAPRNDMRVRPS